MMSRVTYKVKRRKEYTFHFNPIKTIKMFAIQFFENAIYQSRSRAVTIESSKGNVKPYIFPHMVLRFISIAFILSLIN